MTKKYNEEFDNIEEDLIYDEEYSLNYEDDENLREITLTLEDDSELRCLVLSVFEVKGQDYIALLPLEDEEYEFKGEFLLYRAEFSDGPEFDVSPIEDEEELNRAIEEYYKSVDFDIEDYVAYYNENPEKEECSCGCHHDHSEEECSCGCHHDHLEEECGCGCHHDHSEEECDCECHKK